MEKPIKVLNNRINISKSKSQNESKVSPNGPLDNIVADPGGAMGLCPPPPVKIGHKKIATECGGLYFMFLAPPPLRSF